MRNHRVLAAVVAISLALVGVFSVSGQEKPPFKSQYNAKFIAMSEREQESYLESLLPPGKRTGAIRAFLLASETNEVNQRTVCSESGSGTARPDVFNSDTYRIKTSSDAVCRNLHNVRNETVLEIDDPSPAQTGHLIFISCTSGGGFVHGHSCLMQEGPVVDAALGREKHGQWEIAVATQAKLGAKTKVSEYAVLKVQKYEISTPH